MLKKNLGQFSKNYRTFYSKYCHYALIRDTGSGKKTYYGSWIQGPGSATLILTCLFESRFIMIWIRFVKTKKQWSESLLNSFKIMVWSIGSTERKYKPCWFLMVLDRCSSWCPFASSVHPPGNKRRRWRKRNKNSTFTNNFATLKYRGITQVSYEIL